MVRKLKKWLIRLVFWTYVRGSWQYDLLCVLILVFILLTPPSVFNRPLFSERYKPEKLEDADPDQKRPKVGLSL